MNWFGSRRRQKLEDAVARTDLAQRNLGMATTHLLDAVEHLRNNADRPNPLDILWANEALGRAQAALRLR